MRAALAAVVLMFASAAAAQAPAPPPMVLSSPAFADYGVLPLKYAPNAHAQTTFAGLSPPLQWTAPPPRTRAYVLTMLDLEAAPGGNPQDQLLWMVVNLPASTSGLPEGMARGRTSMLPEGAFQRSFVSNGYVGPQPGADRRPHHYVFELYTLDQPLDAPRDVTLDQMRAAAKGHETGERRVLIVTCCTASR